MRFRTSGTLRHLDFGPLVDLLPVLREEWMGLRFGSDGAVFNPLTGLAEPSFVLASGEHRRPGSRYVITEMQAESSASGPRAQDAGEVENRLVKRERRRKEKCGPEPVMGSSASAVVVHIVVERDDDRGTVVRFVDPAGIWWVEVSLAFHSGRLPSATLTADADLTESLRASKTPATMVAMFGGHASARARVEPVMFDRGGTFAEVVARANRLRAAGHLRSSRDEVAGLARVDVRIDLTARGLARPLLWVMSGFGRRHLRSSADKMWVDLPAWCERAADALAALPAAVEAEGGQATFVRRLIWDRGYDLWPACTPEVGGAHPPG